MEPSAARDAVRSALSAFPFDGPGPARSLYAYAPVFRVRDRAGDWVLKRTGLAGSSGTAIAAWTGALSDAGVAVVAPAARFAPNPRRLPDGHEWVVYPYVAGEAYRATASQLRGAGALLAHVHANAAAEGRGLRTIGTPPDRPATWVAAHADRARVAMERHGSDDADLVRALARRVATVPALPLTAGSADFKAANLVFGLTTTLVDPDHAARLPRVYDLAIAVLLFHNDCRTAPARLWRPQEWTTFRDGYLERSTLTADEIRAWPHVLALAWRDQGVWLLGNFPEGWGDPRERAYLAALAAFDPSDFPLPG